MVDRKCVLVIEDDDMVRDFIKTVLNEAGYQVIGAANGAEGLRAMESQRMDVVITDILMPEKEGIETIIEIKKSRPEIRLIAISGGGRAHNFHPLEVASKFGADMTLPKPFEPGELLKVVEAVTAETPDTELSAKGASL